MYMWDFSVRCKNLLTFYMSILLQRIDVMYRSLSVLTFWIFFFFFGGGGGGGQADRQGARIWLTGPAQWCQFCQYMYYLPQGGDVLLWIRKL